MPKSNPSYGVKAWLVFLAAITLMLLTILATLYFLSYQKEHANQRQSSSEYRANTANHGPEACRAVMYESGLMPWLLCFTDSLAADGNAKQSHYDLNAQQDMAEWALLMTIVTGFVALITLAGVVIVWLTFKETAAGVLVMRQEQRPWVGVEIVGDAIIVCSDGAPARLKCKLVAQNYGVRPATSFIKGFRVMFLDGSDQLIVQNVLEGLFERLKAEEDVNSITQALMPDQTVGTEQSENLTLPDADRVFPLICTYSTYKVVGSHDLCVTIRGYLIGGVNGGGIDASSLKVAGEIHIGELDRVLTPTMMC